MQGKYCHNCGALLLDEMKFCPYCGTKRFVLQDNEIKTDPVQIEESEMEISETDLIQCPEIKPDSVQIEKYTPEISETEHIVWSQEPASVLPHSEIENAIQNTEKKDAAVEQNWNRKAVPFWPILLLWCWYLFWAIWAHGLRYGIPLETVMANERTIRVLLSIVSSLVIYELTKYIKPWLCYLITFLLFFISVNLGLGFPIIILGLVIKGIIGIKL